MSETAIRLTGVGKMYRLYRRPADRVVDALGVNRLLFWRRDYFQEFWALRDLNIEAKRGDRLGLIGANGAGKTTVLKIIAGNTPATNGSVTVNGRVQALMELGTGFHPEFTGRQNIRASLSYQGLSGAQIRHKEDEIVDFAELEAFIDQPIKTYSAGMYARLAFSTATSIEPEILIIDELLGVGDAYFVGKCIERMRVLTSGGTTVVFVSHDMASVQRLCDRVLWLNRGRIEAQGDTLTVAKLYLRHMREREERRLRALNLRAHEGASSAELSALGDDIEPLTARFVSADRTFPLERHPISRVMIRNDDTALAEVQIGETMDNDPGAASHTIAEPGQTEWSEPVHVEGRYCREFRHAGGRSRQAAIQLGIERHGLRDGGAYWVEIEYFDAGGEPIAFEIHDGSEYVRLGTIAPAGTQTWRLARLPIEDLTGFMGAGAAPEEPVPEAPLDVHGGREVAIEAVDFLDEQGHERFVFSLGAPMTIRVRYRVIRQVDQVVIALCVYTRDGILAYKDIEATDTPSSTPGAYVQQYAFDSCPFGPKDYVVSVGLYRDFDRTDDSRLQPHYCIWDRRSHFRVAQPVGVGIELGLLQCSPAKKAWKDA